MKILRQVAWLAVLWPLSFGWAQQDSAKNAANAADKTVAAQNEAAAQVEKLGRMVAGTWELEGVSEPSAERPKVRHDTGRSVITYGPGRRSLTEDFRSHGDTGEIVATGTFWWDAQAHGYRTMFCETRDPSGCSVYDGLGHWEGAKVVNRWEFERNGKKTISKQVIETATAQTFIATFYDGDSDATLKQTYTWKHTRVTQAH